MYAKALIFGLLSTSVMGSQFYKPVQFDFGAMLKRGEAIAKRQEGYRPTSGGSCSGSGDTCEQACGAGWQQCASSDDSTHCYDSKQSHCCNDMSGLPCENGYYCTTDSASDTYCCPDGVDLVACAQSYSLTVSLIRQSSTAAVPPASDVSSAGASVTKHPTGSASVKPTGDGTVTTGTPAEFTGAAAKATAKGMAVLAGVAGVAGLL